MVSLAVTVPLLLYFFLTTGYTTTASCQRKYDIVSWNWEPDLQARCTGNRRKMAPLCVCLCVLLPPSAPSRTNQPCVCKRPTKQQRPNNNTTNTTKTDALSTNRPPTVHLTSVQTNSEGKEQDQKMPRKSGRKIKPDGVADPLAAHDDDQAALDAGEVSRSWLMCTS